MDEELGLCTRCWCYSREDPEFGWYWRLDDGERRINGGLAVDLRDACRLADWAQEKYRSEKRRGLHD